MGPKILNQPPSVLGSKISAHKVLTGRKAGFISCLSSSKSLCRWRHWRMDPVNMNPAQMAQMHHSLFYSSSFRTCSLEAGVAAAAAAAAASPSSRSIFCISLTRIRTMPPTTIAAVPRVQIHRILRPGLFWLHLVTIGGAAAACSPVDASGISVQAEFGVSLETKARLLFFFEMDNTTIIEHTRPYHCYNAHTTNKEALTPDQSPYRQFHTIVVLSKPDNTPFIYFTPEDMGDTFETKRSKPRWRAGGEGTLALQPAAPC